jgi:hypothetical protein
MRKKGKRRETLSVKVKLYNLRLLRIDSENKTYRIADAKVNASGNHESITK